nr:PKD domain-containing protein [Bacteroidota bacterium]
MKENPTFRKKEALAAKDLFKSAGFFVIAFFAMLSGNLTAQVCCPEFILKDAVEICPVEGACKDGDPTGQSDRGLAACKESAHVYTVYPNDAGYSYTWSVTGGTPTSFTGNPNVIVWGTGNVGYIKVVISNLPYGGDCIDSITAQVCLIDGPEADFMMDNDTVCVNEDVYFTNLSLGGSAYLWDFGDGTTSTSAGPLTHAYTTPGTYTVMLTATDMGAGHWVFIQEPPMEMLVPCGCSDTITKTIVVLPGEGPKIETDCCYGTVCPDETSSFCTPVGCPTYNWTVTGGIITSGAGTNCIVVTWNSTYSVPTTVSLETPGCSTSLCGGITTLYVPVLYPNLPVGGPAVLCQGASGTFSLPTLPGTFYTWTVSGGSHQFNQKDRNVSSVNITFFDPVTYTVKCDYNNPLAGCSGSSIFTVNVLPEFSIFNGDETVCEGSTMQYDANGTANWSVSPAGSTITLIGAGASANISWNNPGTYTITATPVNPAIFCNTSAVKVVEVIALPVLNNIAGADTICPGDNYTYSITSNTTGSPFVWAVTVGTGSIFSEMGADKDSVIVQFSGAGPWQLDVYQEIEITPGVFCQSLTKTVTVYPFQPPSITGTNTVCVDAIEAYSAGVSSSQGNIQWSISPSSQGTIQSGQGTNSVNILWHGPTATATLTVSTCTGSDSHTVTVNGPPNAVVTYSTLPIFCQGDALTLTLSASTGAGYSYQWYKGITPVGVDSSTHAINIASLALGTYQYYVDVTKNGCIVKSNIIDVVIKNCVPGTPGGPPGPAGCDVVAYFWSYVECDQVTLIDKSYTIPPATIATYTWSVTGPGTGTFSPNVNDPNPVLTVSASGTYTIKLVDTSSTGCTSQWIQTVNILLPVASFTYSAPVCVGNPVMFMASPNNPNYHYAWDFGDGFTSFIANTEHAYAVASPPVYTVNLFITDEKGCVASATQNITVNPKPACTISAADTMICPGGFETLTACSGMSPYQWYKNGNLISGANSSTYNVYQHGEYWVEITNAFGCPDTSNHIYMYMHPLPVARITGEGHVCAYPSSVSGVYLTTVFDTDYSYSWSSNPAGASFSPPNGDATWASLTMPAVLPAIYEFIVDVTDVNTGCVNSDTLCVYFFETPMLSVPPLNICEGSPIILTPTPSDPTKYSYQWSNGATTPTIVASAPGYYSLTITDLVNGCSATADAGFIFEKPDLSLFPLGCADICPPDTLNLYIPLPLNNIQWPYNTYPSAYPSITWYDNGDYTSPVGFGETFDFPSAGSGNHQFSVVVQNNFGCVDTAGVFCLTDNEVCCEIIVDWTSVVDATCPQSSDGSFTIMLNPSSVGGPFTLTKYWPLPVQSWAITPGVPFTVSGLAPGGYGFTLTDATGECEEFFDISIGYLS